MTAALHRIRRGLDLPIRGAPEQEVFDGPAVSRVAIVADDFPGLKPRILVEEGEVVKRGQPILEDRKTPRVQHTAPGAGRVIGIHRGARRALQTVVIDLSDGERDCNPSQEELVSFRTLSQSALQGGDALRELLLASGLWTALRTRPYSKVANPALPPEAIFVTAIDTNPLAARPEAVLASQWRDFETGLRAIATLVEGPTYLCMAPDSGIEGHIDAPVEVVHFAGPHPAGCVGVHIHTLAPVSRGRRVWHLGYQDVASLGRLLASGRLEVDRVVSLAGPSALRPRLLRSRVGACVDELVAGELEEAEVRTISGSVFSGKRADGDVFSFMGRYDLQVSCLREGRERELLGWAGPGRRIFSVMPVFLSRLLGDDSLEFTTSTRGSPRAMVPIGAYEKVMPLDILPTFLLRALEVGDPLRAEQLGALELDEEDLALCTFVDPSKQDYGPLLRRCLERIEADQ